LSMIARSYHTISQTTGYCYSYQPINFRIFWDRRSVSHAEWGELDSAIHPITFNNKGSQPISLPRHRWSFQDTVEWLTGWRDGEWPCSRFQLAPQTGMHR
jgi:hypothetical protein